MIKLKNLLKESMQDGLEKYQSNISKADTFNDFLQSLVGKKLKDLLDVASYSRLYLMNLYGLGAGHDTDDIKVLLSKLIGGTADYINYRKITPLRKKIDDVDAEERNTPEYKAWNSHRANIFKKIVQANKDGDKELYHKLIAQKAELPMPTTSYSKNMKDMEAIIKHFHNSPLGIHDVIPSPDDTKEDKERYDATEKAFIDFKNRMLS